VKKKCRFLLRDKKEEVDDYNNEDDDDDEEEEEEKCTTYPGQIVPVVFNSRAAPASFEGLASLVSGLESLIFPVSVQIPDPKHKCIFKSIDDADEWACFSELSQQRTELTTNKIRARLVLPIKTKQTHEFLCHKRIVLRVK